MAQKERVAPVAVITGASSGLGAVFARIAAREGYRPVLVARRQQRLEALAAEIETASGLKPWVLALDLTESAELSRLMDFLETRSVTPEIFINNAGFGDFGPMVDADEERISRMLRLNIAALTEIPPGPGTKEDQLPGSIPAGQLTELTIDLFHGYLLGRSPAGQYFRCEGILCRHTPGS